MKYPIPTANMIGKPYSLTIPTRVKSFSISLILFITAGILSLGLNAPPLLATSEYTQFSTRGKSELTLKPDGSLKESTGGLSRDYITQFSYGIFETLNLIIPRIQGGGSTENLGEN